jgi:hypothetical protein
MQSRDLKNREVLLINFDFPPNEGIGGRRWGKLAKALAQSGVIVHVVKADPIQELSPSAWASDTKHENIRVHSVPRNFPIAFSHPKPTLWGKLLYRFHKKKIELTTRGTLYDQSIFWDTYMTPTCRRIIDQHEISAIIATGAPWNLLVYTAKLKKYYPAIPVLVDYRDPWLTAVNYGMRGLTEQRMAAEIEKQQFVFQHVDIVTTPYAYLTDQLRNWSSTHSTHQPKFITLPHFYDEADFSKLPAKAENHDEVRIVYAGDIYASSENNWKHLIQCIERLQQHPSVGAKQISIDIYTAAIPPNFIAACPFIHIHKPIGKAVFDTIAQSDICLLVLSDNKKDEQTTKFFEYLRCRKPLLVSAPAGEVTQFIQSNRLGMHIGCTEQELRKLVDGHYFQTQFNRTFPLESFELSTRCEQLKELLF